ncbi:MAG: hypothetical protein ACRCZE_05000 [Candidatus Altimarinota bacterium]
MRKSIIETAEYIYTQQRIKELKDSIKTFLSCLGLEDVAYCEGKVMMVTLFQDDSLVVNEMFQLEDALDYDEEEWDEVLMDILTENPSFLNDMEIRIRVKMVEGGEEENEDNEEMPEEIKNLVQSIIKGKKKILN